jgi:hypothetical protein
VSSEESGNNLLDSLCQHLTAAALAGKVLAQNLASKSAAEAKAASQLVGNPTDILRTFANSGNEIAILMPARLSQQPEISNHLQIDAFNRV